MTAKKKSGSKKPDPKKNGQANGNEKKTQSQAKSGQAWERGESVKCAPNEEDPLEEKTD